MSLTYFKGIFFDLLNDKSSIVVESLLEQVDVVYNILSSDKVIKSLIIIFFRPSQPNFCRLGANCISQSMKSGAVMRYTGLKHDSSLINLDPPSF